MYTKNSDNMSVPIIILGDENVGKTNIIHRIMNQPFEKKHLPTRAVEYYTRKLKVFGFFNDLEIWDSIGSERFKGLNTVAFNSQSNHPKNIFIVFDLTDQCSYKRIPEHLIECSKRCPNLKKSFIFIIGNKSDLEDERVVDSKDAKDYAESLGFPYFEVSAKSNVGIKEVFKAITKQALRMTYGGENHQNPAIRLLYQRIQALKDHADLMVEGERKDQILALHTNLFKETEDFFGDLSFDESEFANFQKRLFEHIKQADKLSIHSKPLIPILFNIALACSIIGIIFMLGKLGHAVFISHKPLSLNRCFFFGLTRSQEITDQIEEAATACQLSQLIL